MTEISLPLQLYHKAKNLFWDPRDVDLQMDVADWTRLGEDERSILTHLAWRFMGGEEAVTHDLTPLLFALRREGNHLDEEMFLTTQLFEEAKHVEWFERWRHTLNVPPAPALGGAFEQLFHHELPSALHRLLADPSPAAQVEAVSTYHVIVEGVLAETGYRGYARALRDQGLMPGTTRGIELVQRDEARHIAFGLHLLQRLLSADPDLWSVLEARLNHLLPIALDIVSEVFAPFDDSIPFGLEPSEFVAYASEQLDHRLQALERVRA